MQRSMDIIDAKTGEVYYTCHSKYDNGVFGNVSRYCQRHNYLVIQVPTDSRGNLFVYVIRREEKK